MLMELPRVSTPVKREPVTPDLRPIIRTTKGFATNES